MLEYVLVSTGEGPPAACPQCGGGLRPATRGADAVRSALDAAVSAVDGEAAPDILLAGGEPLSLDGARELVRTARAAGSTRVAAFTGGAPLAGSSEADAFVSAGLNHAHFFLPGPDADTVASLTDGPAFEVVCEGIRQHRAAGERLGLRTAQYGRVPVCTHNAMLLPDTVRVLAEQGVLAVVLSVTSGADMRSALPWLAAAFDTGLMNGIWVWIEGVAADLLGPASAAVRAPLRIREAGA